jgi:hypothetical protein
MKKFTQVVKLIDSLEADVDKFYNKGNQAAGTRLRKGMQELKNLTTVIRKEILVGRPNNGGPGKAISSDRVKKGPNNGGPGME